MYIIYMDFQQRKYVIRNCYNLNFTSYDIKIIIFILVILIKRIINIIYDYKFFNY